MSLESWMISSKLALDVSFCCLVSRYGLECPNAILAEEKHEGLFKAIVEAPYTPEYVAGGSCQNTVRVAQWMLQQTGATAYAGCVGDDANAVTLRKCAEGDGVNVSYMVDASVPTGTCACLIKEKDRSMVARLAAANKYESKHLDEENVKAIWSNAANYVIEGYFLTVAVPAMLTIAEHASSNKKDFALSLSAPFICQFFSEPLLKVIVHSNIVFGNEVEAETIAKTLKWEETDLESIAKNISTKIDCVGGRTRTTIITWGAKDVIVAVGDKVQRFAVPKLESSEIVDTNGAGDAFAGGFMAGHVQGKDLKTCVDAGNYAAQHILRTSGTSLRGTPTFKW